MLVAVVPVDFTLLTFTGKKPTGTLEKVTSPPSRTVTTKFPVTPKYKVPGDTKSVLSLGVIATAPVGMLNFSKESLL